jgi:peptidoglycan/xylan/chitin deacetylase (PgdA/CDA1 family)
MMLTFDDGYKDFLETAWPILERYDFVAEVFLVTERIGESADWDGEYGEPAPLLSWDDVKVLSARGVRFGSHLATHRAADGLDTEEILREGASSRASLQKHLNQEIRDVALPFGAIDNRVLGCLRICGYQVAYTTRTGVASTRGNPLELPRIEITGDDGIVEFARKLGRLPELGLHP